MYVKSSAECRAILAQRNVKTIAYTAHAQNVVEIRAFLVVRSVPGSASITSAARNVVSCVTGPSATNLAIKFYHAATVAVV